MNETTTAELARYREADSEELLDLVQHHLPELGVVEVRQILRNPFATREVVEALLGRTQLLSFYEVRRDLALHPRTPQTQALRLVPGLYWRDLMALGADSRVRPVVRRAADRYLAARLPGMAVGEKMAIARRCGPGVLSELRRDPSPRVVGAVLENPRLTEGLLMPVVHQVRTAPTVLALIARDRRWGVRYPLRLGLAKNSSTPTDVALRLLPHLKKNDLRVVASDVKINAAVRRRAQVLLGEA